MGSGSTAFCVRVCMLLGDNFSSAGLWSQLWLVLRDSCAPGPAMVHVIAVLLLDFQQALLEDVQALWALLACPARYVIADT